ncbi:14138_t:CDS:2, partial [Acaulospora colombiana]
IFKLKKSYLNRVVAILLTIFGLDVEEAIEAFIRICNTVFPKEGCTPSARATMLETVTKELLEERKLPLDLKLQDDRNLPCATCQRAILANAVSFVPTLEEEIVSAVHGYNNPTLEVLKEALDVFGSNAYLSCLLSLGAGKGIIKSFGAGASGAGGAAGAPREDSPETGKNESNNPMSILEQLTTDGESIAEEASRRIGNLGVYFRFSVTRGLDFDDLAAQRNGVSTKFGEIIAHTTGYLLENTTSNYLDKAIASAERPSTISLETISLRSSHGLPPLSSFFIMREEPMKFLVEMLLETEEDSQRIVVLSGLGGSGKTQMALKFARDYEHRTTENIETALVTHVSSLGREYECSSVNDALDILAEPDQVITQDWLIIFDNADDPNIDLRDYFPTCEHGSILITTRNLMLGDLSSRRHLELDVMSPEEAVETLLITAFTQGESPTEEDKKEASVIVEQLGYLPVAITQAGCYIRQQKCLHDYANRLKANRRKLLERPTRTHRDKLRYRHSVYAAFDVTLEVLSSRARDFLRILSTVHFTNFPLPLIGAAAKGGFAFEINDLLDRPSEHQETISLLKETFCPDGEWDNDQITDLLEELQQYSLVVVVASATIATLRFHPLVHSWAYDRLTEKEEKMYQAAAVRLIACGTDWVHVSLFDYLSPHIYSLSSIWDKLHVNDRSAFARIIRYDGKADMLFQLTKDICDEVEKVAGKESVRATSARLDLADAYGMIDDDKKMEEMEREVVATREAILGREDLITIEAVSNLASTIEDDDNRLEEALALREEVLKVRKEKHGMDHQDTADAMAYLGQTYHRLKRYSDEEPLLISAREIRAKGLGPAHPWTIDVMVSLANCYTDCDDYDKAEAIQKEVLQLETKQLGVKHVETVKTMEWMCRAYYNQRKYAEAEKLGEQALILRKEISGPRDDDTVSWMDWLARVYHDTGKFADAKRLREEEIECRKEVVGEQNTAVHDAISWLVSALHSLGEYQKHEELAKQLLVGRTALLGDKHVETLNAKSWLARAYHDLKRHKEAGELRKEEWEVRCEVQGERHIDTINSLGWLARAYHEQGRHEEAASLREKELEQRKSVQGERHIDAVNTLSWLARAYQELKR